MHSSSRIGAGRHEHIALPTHELGDRPMWLGSIVERRLPIQEERSRWDSNVVRIR
ncbi:hypothetical protein [Streptomyces sp. NPDC053720]|uniref:hypothetical protein n=1 Tax=Streptomyces sp. NPDC053720 TaxID=3154855 RepID=UPI003447BD74